MTEIGSHTVIALNGGRADGLIEDTKLRVVTAIELARRLNAEGRLGRLIMAGNEAFDMYSFSLGYLAESAPNDLVMPIEYENSSRDTIGNAHFTKTRRKLTPATDPNIHVVTVKWHMPRSLWTFDRVLGAEYNIEPDPSVDPYSQSPTLRAMSQEMAGYALSCFILHNVAPEDDEKREARLTRWHPRYR